MKRKKLCIISLFFALLLIKPTIQAREIDSFSNEHNYINDIKVNDTISDYDLVKPYNTLLKNTTIVEKSIEEKNVMVKNGLIPWWDDEYKSFKSDIYILYKYETKINTCIDDFKGNFDKNDDNSVYHFDNNPVYIDKNITYEYSIFYQCDYEYTVEKSVSCEIEAEFKTKYEASANASICVLGFDIKKSQELSTKIKNSIVLTETNKLKHTNGWTKKIIISDIKEPTYYRYEKRAVFEIYSLYHFKANYEIKESKRLWNSIYYDVNLNNYELVEIVSKPYLLPNSTYEGFFKYKKNDHHQFVYDDVKEGSSIIYI